jgi:hypothetical protein
MSADSVAVSAPPTAMAMSIWAWGIAIASPKSDSPECLPIDFLDRV